MHDRQLGAQVQGDFLLGPSPGANWRLLYISEVGLEAPLLEAVEVALLDPSEDGRGETGGLAKHILVAVSVSLDLVSDELALCCHHFDVAFELSL